MLQCAIAHTSHPMAFHSAHLVFCLERGQQGSTNSDPIQHGAELQHNWFFLQSFRQLWILIGLHWSLINT